MTDWTDLETTASLAGGCFWGMEHWFKKKFGNAIQGVCVGYCGGDFGPADYKTVKTGVTGHAETLQFTFNPEKTSYADILRFFFNIHNPTTKNQQAGDIGTQYRSAIFYHTDNQKKIAEEVISEVQKDFTSPIVTQLAYLDLAKFYKAEDYHQAYLDANPDGYCAHRPRVPFTAAEEKYEETAPTGSTTSS